MDNLEAVEFKKENDENITYITATQRNHMYSHYTCATNTEDMKAVFTMVTDGLLFRNMVNLGIYWYEIKHFY